MTPKQESELIEKLHIKYLEKAYEAKINGSNMTVLPYGYLSQAIKEALSHQREEVIDFNKAELNQLIGLVKDKVINGSYYGNKNQYYRRNERILEKLNSLKGKEDV
jgi:hypothetical protein